MENHPQREESDAHKKESKTRILIILKSRLRNTFFELLAGFDNGMAEFVVEYDFNVGDGPISAGVVAFPEHVGPSFQVEMHFTIQDVALNGNVQFFISYGKGWHRADCVLETCEEPRFYKVSPVTNLGKLLFNRDSRTHEVHLHAVKFGHPDQAHHIATAYIPALPRASLEIDPQQVPSAVKDKTRAICRLLGLDPDFLFEKGDVSALSDPKSGLRKGFGYYMPFPDREQDPGHWLYRDILDDLDKSEAGTDAGDALRESDLDDGDENSSTADAMSDGDFVFRGPVPAQSRGRAQWEQLLTNRVIERDGVRIEIIRGTADLVLTLADPMGPEPVELSMMNQPDDPRYWCYFEWRYDELAADRALREWLYSLEHADAI